MSNDDIHLPIPRRKSLTVKKSQALPIVYSKELGEKIAHLYGVEGLTLKKIGELPGMPEHGTILSWQFRIKEFSDIMDTAFMERAKNWAREIVDISDQAEVNNANPQHTKNRMLARQWIAERLIPKVYGSKTYVNHSGEVNLGIAERLLKAKDLLDLQKSLRAEHERDIIDVTPIEHGIVSRETIIQPTRE